MRLMNYCIQLTIGKKTRQFVHFLSKESLVRGWLDRFKSNLGEILTHYSQTVVRLQTALSNLPIKIAILWENIARKRTSGLTVRWNVPKCTQLYHFTLSNVDGFTCQGKNLVYWVVSVSEGKTF